MPNEIFTKRFVNPTKTYRPGLDCAEKAGECDECGMQGTVYLDGKDLWICKDCLLAQYEDGDFDGQ